MKNSLTCNIPPKEGAVKPCAVTGGVSPDASLVREIDRVKGNLDYVKSQSADRIGKVQADADAEVKRLTARLAELEADAVADAADWEAGKVSPRSRRCDMLDREIRRVKEAIAKTHTDAADRIAKTRADADAEAKRLTAYLAELEAKIKPKAVKPVADKPVKLISKSLLEEKFLDAFELHFNNAYTVLGDEGVEDSEIARLWLLAGLHEFSRRYAESNTSLSPIKWMSIVASKIMEAV